ncbi:MAG: type II secretion system F family protein [Patescibacteria group bacterium]|nr:type II secretion system F family protein [Patescibacteria group bacterium]
MKFSYTAATPQGKIKTGLVEAADRKSAAVQLAHEQLSVVRIAAVRQWSVHFSHISLLQRMLIAQHLATLLSAGVSLLEALRVIEDEARTRRMRKVIARVRMSVDSGTTLAGALEAQGHSFDPLFVSLVRVGESSGTLEENLQYLSEELEKRLNLRSKVRAAATYPGVVVMVTAVLGAVLVYFVLPKIVPLFSSLKVKLPLTTVALLWVATFMRNSGVLAFILTVAVIVLLRSSLLLPSVRLAWHRALVRMPVAGRVVRNINLANTCRTLGTLLKSGVPIVEALDITAETSRNVAYQQEIFELRSATATGQSLAAAMAGRSGRMFFSPLTLSLVRVGETSGKLDESLLYLNRFYEREVDSIMKDLSVILEPALLVFIGLIVALVVSAIITPIYQISGSLQVR